MIKILEKYFPKQNLLFLTQEEMRKNLEAVSTKIREFISLNGDFELKKGFRSQRKGLSVGAIKILSFLNGFFVNTPSFGGEPPDTKVPHFAYKNLVRVIRVLDFFLLSRFSTKSSSMLDEELKRAILSQFHEDNLNLQSYFDKELIRSFYLN